jgi:hypothetical protein
MELELGVSVFIFVLRSREALEAIPGVFGKSPEK